LLSFFAFAVVVFLAALYGFMHWVKKVSAQKLRMGVVCFSVLFMGVPQLFQIEQYLWDASYGQNQKTVKILEAITSEYSVLTTEIFAAHLSHRSQLFVFSQIWPQTPFTKEYKNPDLIIVDETRIKEKDRSQVAQFLHQGYPNVFELSHLKIYANPTVAVEFQGQVKPHLQAINSSVGEIPYRKWVRYTYKRGVLFLSILLGLLLLWRQRKIPQKQH